MTAQQKLEAYKRQVKREVTREIEAQFDQRVETEARQLFDETLKWWHSHFEQAERTIKEFDATLNRRKPIMSKRMFRILMASVQPDKGGTHAAAAEFNSKREAIEAALCGSEAEQRKWALPDRLARTREELMAARAKVQAENSARAERAAATRAPLRSRKRPSAEDEIDHHRTLDHTCHARVRQRAGRSLPRRPAASPEAPEPTLTASPPSTIASAASPARPAPIATA